MLDHSGCKRLCRRQDGKRLSHSSCTRPQDKTRDKSERHMIALILQENDGSTAIVVLCRKEPVAVRRAKKHRSQLSTHLRPRLLPSFSLTSSSLIFFCPWSRAAACFTHPKELVCGGLWNCPSPASCCESCWCCLVRCALSRVWRSESPEIAACVRMAGGSRWHHVTSRISARRTCRTMHRDEPKHALQRSNSPSSTQQGIETRCPFP